MSVDDGRDPSTYRRPHYGEGDRVRIILPGSYHNVPATVRAVSAMQTTGGHVVTYYYRVQLDSLAHLMLAEDQIAPIPD